MGYCYLCFLTECYYKMSRYDHPYLTEKAVTFNVVNSINAVLYDTNSGI